MKLSVWTLWKCQPFTMSGYPIVTYTWPNRTNSGQSDRSISIRYPRSSWIGLSGRTLTPSMRSMSFLPPNSPSVHSFSPGDDRAFKTVLSAQILEELDNLVRLDALSLDEAGAKTFVKAADLLATARYRATERGKRIAESPKGEELAIEEIAKRHPA